MKGSRLKLSIHLPPCSGIGGRSAKCDDIPGQGMESGRPEIKPVAEAAAPRVEAAVAPE
jgi:hypothetical protein